MKQAIKIFGALLLVASGLEGQAQDTAPAQSNVLEYSMLVLGAVAVLAALGAIWYMINTLLYLQKVRLLEQYGPAQLAEAGMTVNQEPLWKRIYKRMTQVVPVEREREVMLDHNYDGIRELDNRLPPWWLALFYITVVFGVVYLYVQHFSDYGISSAEEYVQEMEAAEEAVSAYLAQQADQVDEETVTALIDEQSLASGELIFQANCATCHGQAGEGGVGPNLTDAYWVHGGNIKEVFKTVKYGVPEKGMIAWKAQLRPADMQRVASFILSLQGTDPPNAKEPEGEYVEPSVVEGSDTNALDAEATSSLLKIEQ